MVQLHAILQNCKHYMECFLGNHLDNLACQHILSYLDNNLSQTHHIEKNNLLERIAG